MKTYKQEGKDFRKEQEEIRKSGWRNPGDLSKQGEYKKVLELRKAGKAPLYYLQDGRGYWDDGVVR